MKNLKFFLFAAACGLVISSCSQSIGSSKVSLKDGKDSLSFALGFSVGSDLKTQFPDVDATVFAKAVAQAYTSDSSSYFKTPQDANTFIQTYIRKEQERKANENIEKEKAFLEENKTKEGVKETESGLQYEVITEGTGAVPTETSVVKVNYHGTLLDGTVFDSSVDRGEPVEFPVNRVIPGWTEGLQLMKVGSKYKFYIPSALGYGPRQVSAEITPNSTLVFEVELLEIVEDTEE